MMTIVITVDVYDKALQGMESKDDDDDDEFTANLDIIIIIMSRFAVFIMFYLLHP